MSTRLRLGLLSLVALGALLWGAGRAAAGGWAIATLEALPQDLVAGQPASFRFAVRQHGITLVDWVAPTLRFEHTVSGQVVNAVAQPAGTVGYFEAEVILPEAGVWEWTVDPFGGSLIQPMPPLSVAEAGPAAAASRLEAPRPAWLWVGLAGLAGLAGGLLLLARTRRPWAGGLALAGAFVAGLSFTLPPLVPGAQAGAPALAANPASAAEVGQALFLAKGCVMCHDHTAIQPLKRRLLGEFHSFSTGPDLSHFTAAPDYLRRWLADPVSVKPQTQMPALGLTAAEIDNLIAFLNAPH